MMLPSSRLLLAACAAIAATGAASAGYRLPDEQAVALLPGRDADLAAGLCAACHSTDYISTQPRDKGAQFWKDSVNKMVTVYGAPIDPETADRIAAYLGKTYGAAQAPDSERRP